MFRIDDPSAAASLPTPEAAGTQGYFTEGNAAGGLAATLMRASWLNMIQEELRAIVVAGGISPSKTTYNQVLTAIQALITQAQGNFTGFVTYTGAQTITVAQAGWLIGFASTTSGATYTLPSPVGRAALTYTFTNYSSFPLTLSTPAGAFTRGGGGSSIVVPAGSGVVLASDSVNWQVVSGDAALQYSSQFAANKAASGYQKLPSGIIIQWGPGSAGSTSAGATVTFPIAFPNACLHVTASDAGNQIYSYGADTYTQTNFRLYGGFYNGGSINYATGSGRYIAIGY